MLIEPAHSERTDCLPNLKGLASVMSSKMRTAYLEDAPKCTVETPHLGINLPKEPRVFLETARSNDTKLAKKTGGANRPEEGSGQIAHERGSDFTRIDHWGDAPDINSLDQTSEAGFLHAPGDVSASVTTLIARDGLVILPGDSTYLGRRH